jgi:hypothetical protein
LRVGLKSTVIIAGVTNYTNEETNYTNEVCELHEEGNWRWAVGKKYVGGWWWWVGGRQWAEVSRRLAVGGRQ